MRKNQGRSSGADRINRLNLLARAAEEEIEEELDDIARDTNMGPVSYGGQEEQRQFNDDVEEEIADFSDQYHISEELAAPIVGILGPKRAQRFRNSYNATEVYAAGLDFELVRDELVEGTNPGLLLEAMCGYVEEALEPEEHNSAFEETVQGWEGPKESWETLPGDLEQHVSGRYVRVSKLGKFIAGDKPLKTSTPVEDAVDLRERVQEISYDF